MRTDWQSADGRPRGKLGGDRVFGAVCAWAPLTLLRGEPACAWVIDSERWLDVVFWSAGDWAGPEGDALGCVGE